MPSGGESYLLRHVPLAFAYRWYRANARASPSTRAKRVVLGTWHSHEPLDKTFGFVSGSWHSHVDFLRLVQGKRSGFAGIVRAECSLRSAKQSNIEINLCGEVTEWLKVHASKACYSLRGTRVRISPSPPCTTRVCLQVVQGKRSGFAQHPSEASGAGYMAQP